MMLDDVYGSDFDRFPLEQQAADWGEEDLGLAWDAADAERIAGQLGAGRPVPA